MQIKTISTNQLIRETLIKLLKKNKNIFLIGEGINDPKGIFGTTKGLNKNFFTKADSTEPEQAGIWGSLVGSFLTIIITLILSLK